MTISYYFFILALSFLMPRLLSNVKSGYLKKLGYLCFFIVLVLFCSMRDISVGTDTASYYHYYRLVSSLEVVFSTDLEIGYLLYNWFFLKFSSSLFLLLLSISVFVIFFVSRGIENYSYSPSLSYFVFVSFGFYAFMFNGARQAMAAAVLFYAFKFYLENRFFPFLAAVIFASLFHQTALSFILLLPVIVFGFSFNFSVAAIIALSPFFVLSLDGLVGYLVRMDDRYSTYADAAGGGELYVLFITLIGLFFYWSRSYVERASYEYDRLLLVYLLGVLISVFAVLVGGNPSGFLRLSFYFLYSAVLLVPIIFVNIKGNVAALLVFLFMTVMAIYYVYSVISFSGLLPYKFASYY